MAGARICQMISQFAAHAVYFYPFLALFWFFPGRMKPKNEKSSFFVCIPIKGKAIGLPDDFLALKEGSKGGGVIQVSWGSSWGVLEVSL
jgi:hypothetical protein